MKLYLLAVLTGRGPAIPLLVFAAAGLLVLVIAGRLARDADHLAARTGFGRVWVGSALLAVATSLPEILTDVNAALFDVPDIGVGDLLGSTLANMLILAVLDLLFPAQRVFASIAAPGLGALAIVLTAVAGSAILTGGWLRIGHVGLETAVIAALYLGAMRRLYRSTASARAVDPVAAPAGPARPALAGFALGAIGLIAVTPALVLAGEALARESGVTDTFVGTLLVGLTTSFPEFAATVSAIRLGAAELALGNILGSNAFNMAVLLLMDAAYRRGPVLAAVSGDHLLTVLAAIASMALGIMAMLAPRDGAVARPRPESVLIVAVWFLAVYALSGHHGR
jgi:cation:H+ antiporter